MNTSSGDCFACGGDSTRCDCGGEGSDADPFSDDLAGAAEVKPEDHQPSDIVKWLGQALTRLENSGTNLDKQWAERIRRKFLYLP